QPHRQRGCRDQDGSQKQERERVLQPAGEEQERRKFGDVERKQGTGINRLQPLHWIECDLQREVYGRRQADDDKAWQDRQIQIEALHHDEEGGELSESREPAQPQDRVQTDIAPRMAKIGGADIGHGGMLKHDPEEWVVVFQKACLANHKLGRAAPQRLRLRPYWPIERPTWHSKRTAKAFAPRRIRSDPPLSRSSIWASNTRRTAQLTAYRSASTAAASPDSWAATAPARPQRSR